MRLHKEQKSEVEKSQVKTLQVEKTTWEFVKTFFGRNNVHEEEQQHNYPGVIALDIHAVRVWQHFA